MCVECITIIECDRCQGDQTIQTEQHNKLLDISHN